MILVANQPVEISPTAYGYYVTPVLTAMGGLK